MNKNLSNDVLDFVLMNFLHVDSENIVDYKCTSLNKNFKNKPTKIVSAHFQYFGEEYKLQEKDFIMMKGKIYESFDSSKNRFSEINLNEEQKQEYKTLLEKHDLNNKKLINEINEL